MISATCIKTGSAMRLWIASDCRYLNYPWLHLLMWESLRGISSHLAPLRRRSEADIGQRRHAPWPLWPAFEKSCCLLTALLVLIIPQSTRTYRSHSHRHRRSSHGRDGLLQAKLKAKRSQEMRLWGSRNGSSPGGPRRNFFRCRMSAAQPSSPEGPSGSGPLRAAMIR